MNAFYYWTRTQYTSELQLLQRRSFTLGHSVWSDTYLMVNVLKILIQMHCISSWPRPLSTERTWKYNNLNNGPVDCRLSSWILPKWLGFCRPVWNVCSVFQPHLQAFQCHLSTWIVQITLESDLIKASFINTRELLRVSILNKWANP